MSNPRKTAFRSIKHPDDREQSTVEKAREIGAERATEAFKPVMWTPCIITNIHRLSGNEQALLPEPAQRQTDAGKYLA